MTKRISLLLMVFLLVAIIPVSANSDFDRIGSSAENTINGEYICEIGKITNPNTDNGISTLFEFKANTDHIGKLNNFNVHLEDETIIIDDSNMKILDRNDVKHDELVSIYYSKYSLNPIAEKPYYIFPELVVVHRSENLTLSSYDVFDNSILSGNNDLRLNIKKDTPIYNLKGELVDVNAIKNQKLLVLYDMVLESYPAQTTPLCVFLINDILVLDRVIINGEEIVLKNNIYYNQIRPMIPVREIAEKLGFKVEWDKNNQNVTIRTNMSYGAVNTEPYNANYHYQRNRLAQVKNGVTYMPLAPYDYDVNIFNAKVSFSDKGILTFTTNK
ncbi:MAG: copper amine oxidase N-terminal domain-containing protein [Tissierellia bacterium]|nr:copper amine oxidase N-terminal domain-containing protein [Tissierellia bacterium]